MASQPWDKVYDRIRVHKSPISVYPFRPTAADLDSVEAELGCRLPASYRAFAERFGLDGELSGWVRLEPLRSPAKKSSVLERTRIWRYTYAGDQLDDARAVGLDFADQLIVFGSDVGGDGFAFHSGEVTNRRRSEYKVYTFARMGDWKTPRADTFAEFVAYAEEEARIWREEEDEDEEPDEEESIVFAPFGGRKRRFTKRDVSAWLGANGNAARNLALAIREQGQIEHFPILGDALEDAGCASEHLLRACRDGNPQADGEWLLAVLLGKK